MSRNLGWIALLATAAVVAVVALLLPSGGGPPDSARPEPVRRPEPVHETGPAARPPRPSTTALQGLAVRRGRGDPLPVEVAVLLPDGSVLGTLAGTDGRFRVEGLPRGTRVDVAVSFQGLATARLSRLVVPSEGALDLPVLSLGAARTIVARVLRANRAALPGALVRVRGMPW